HERNHHNLVVTRMVNDEETVETIRGAIHEAMTEMGPSGLVMTLVTDEEFIWTEAFGHLDRTKKTKVDTETLFAIQSTSKMINAIAFMFAVQDGLIGLDDKLVKYFPEFRVKSRWGSEEGNKITFRYLLSHQSGLPQMTRKGSVFDDSPHTFEEHIRSVIDTWLEYPVGSRYFYSNIGMDLVSYSIERASGMSFPEFVNDRLAEPLGITITYGSIEAKKNPNRAIGYEHPKIPIHIGTALAYGCGGAWMNISDLAVLTQFLLNKGRHNRKQVLREDLLDQMMTTQFEDDEGYTYGLGTSIFQGGNIRIVEHAGGGFGYAGLLAIAPGHGVGAAVEMNMENVNLAYKLVLQAIDLALKGKGIERTTPSKEDFLVGAKQDSSEPELSRLEGLYAGVWGSVRVKVNDGKLVIVIDGNDHEFTPHSEYVFVSEGTPPVARFVMNETHVNNPFKLTLLTSMTGPVDLFYREPLATGAKSVTQREHWESLAGLYRARYYGAHMFYIAVKVLDGKLVYSDWSGPIPLYPFEDEPMTFFTSGGTHYEFGNASLRFSNRLATRVDDPVSEVLEAIEKEIPTSMLTDWVMDQEIRLLEFLDRKNEAEMIRDMRSKIHE
ncbi:MAG: beta-lactamase family protein, partial [Candidatus Thorarchaeota archaeon]